MAVDLVLGVIFDVAAINLLLGLALSPVDGRFISEMSDLGLTAGFFKAGSFITVSSVGLTSIFFATSVWLSGLVTEAVRFLALV